jgi:hypothetical protein
VMSVATDEPRPLMHTPRKHAQTLERVLEGEELPGNESDDFSASDGEDSAGPVSKLLSRPALGRKGSAVASVANAVRLPVPPPTPRGVTPVAYRAPDGRPHMSPEVLQKCDPCCYQFVAGDPACGVTLSIEGKGPLAPSRVLFDTGAERNVVARAWAERKGLEWLEQLEPVRGVAGADLQFLGRIPKERCAITLCRGTEGEYTARSDVWVAEGECYDLLLGTPFINQCSAHVVGIEQVLAYCRDLHATPRVWCTMPVHVCKARGLRFQACVVATTLEQAVPPLGQAQTARAGPPTGSVARANEAARATGDDDRGGEGVPRGSHPAQSRANAGTRARGRRRARGRVGGLLRGR